ncbi:MAG: bifunctional 5,10-methylenetetrahydrofolate dehydrogenase/5,10-methenyltetrahydrofolate cyclohydrolase [Thermoplasmatota archaeon]
MTSTIIDGNKISNQIKKEISKQVQSLQSIYHKTPHIITLLIGDDAGSKLYLKLRDKACKQVGINSSQLIFDEKVSQKELLTKIDELNNDETIHGILIQYPVPSHISQDTLMSNINPTKDVEGFHPYNMGQTILGNETIIPCTPQAVLEILKNQQIQLCGKTICIVNHSNIVGKPLAALLLNRNATVSVCHIYTADIKQFTSTADIVITAAGVPKLITSNHVKNSACVIDVAIIPTSHGICGDVDFESVKNKVKCITPVPGGVGPVTIACALKNMIQTFNNAMHTKS